MERIKQAIEKAKRQGEHPVEGPRVNAVLPALAAEIASISYSSTRTVELDKAHLEKNRIIAFNKNDPMSVCFDLLRTQVLQKMEEKGWRTLAVISPVPECGKTVVAINLGISIAHYTSKTAMLVDFDLRRPRVGAYLGIPPEKSLNDVLSGEAELSEAFVNPGMPKLVVIPTSKPVQKSAEILGSQKVSDLIKELRDRYQERIVVFDLPPMLSSDDAISVLPQIDCVLIVVGSGMVTRTEMTECMHQLGSANLLGVVLNKAQVQPRKYYY